MQEYTMISYSILFIVFFIIKLSNFDKSVNLSWE